MGSYIIRDVQDFLIERWGQKQMRRDVDLQLAAHAKQVRLENAQLREQNRVLREALLKVRPELYCMDKQLIASGYKRGVSVADAMKALEAALTATSQEGQHGSR